MCPVRNVNAPLYLLLITYYSLLILTTYLVGVASTECERAALPDALAPRPLAIDVPAVVRSS